MEVKGIDGKLEKSDSTSADEISHLSIDIGGNFLFESYISGVFFLLVCEILRFLFVKVKRAFLILM